MPLSGIINLKACKSYKNKFEQGMINEFTVEAVDLGDLEKLRIGHDNSGRKEEAKKTLILTSLIQAVN